jgi:hypothetical protein
MSGSVGWPRIHGDEGVDPRIDRHGGAPGRCRRCGPAARPTGQLWRKSVRGEHSHGGGSAPDELGRCRSDGLVGLIEHLLKSDPFGPGGTCAQGPRRPPDGGTGPRVRARHRASFSVSRRQRAYGWRILRRGRRGWRCADTRHPCGCRLLAVSAARAVSDGFRRSGWTRTGSVRGITAKRAWCRRPRRATAPPSRRLTFESRWGR